MVCPCKLLVSAKNLGQVEVTKKREVDTIYLNTKCTGLGETESESWSAH